MPKIPPVKLPMNAILNILILEKKGLKNSPYFNYVDENGIIETVGSLPNCYIIRYTLFRYGNIYEKELNIYLSRKYPYQLEKKGFYFQPSYLTHNLKGINTLTDEEEKKREQFFDYISNGGVNVEEFNRITTITKNLPVKPPPVKLPLLDILDSFYNEIENGLEDRDEPSYTQISKIGIIKLVNILPDYYVIKYTLFRYGNIYEKEIKLYKSKKSCHHLYSRGFYFQQPYLTDKIKGRNTLTDDEKKERENFFHFISVFVDIEEFNSIP